MIGRKNSILILVCLLALFGFSHSVTAKGMDSSTNESDIYKKRTMFFYQISAITGVPWYDLAAIDQYDRSMERYTKTNQHAKKDRIIAVHYTQTDWTGWMNPDKEDRNPASIAFFQGKGKDGSGDGWADWNNNVDVLYTEAQDLLQYGLGAEDFPIALWHMYHNPRSIQRIVQFATIYQKLGSIPMDQHAFPLPLRSDYSYRSTWGASRGWGGYRIHEGTDLFAEYGVPVRSTCYGIIEVRGWNRYGGWRVGIRSLHNVYHYFAHLSGFNKKLQVGDVVKPGQVIGWVGSSGYGKKGTQGKFPPHLHYGLYRDHGLTDWSFDPYYFLRKWEREERRKK